MNTQPCVFIVDDDEAVREGLEMVMETVGLACKTFGSAEQFLENFSQTMLGCLVLDMNMPGMKGDELQIELQRRNIRLPIIFLTAFGDIPASVRAMKAGAADFLTKPVQINLLIERIQAELQHAAQMQEQKQGEQKLRGSLKSLTPREIEILPLAIAGVVNKEIAKKLGISYRTVEYYRAQILRKTDAANFLELGRNFELAGISVESNSSDF